MAHTIPFINITEAGTALLANPPAHHQPAQGGKRKPVNVSIHHDLTIEMHGDNFSVSAKLTPDEALGLITKLSYVLGEVLYVEGLRK